MRKRKKLRITKLEKVMYMITLLMIIVSPVAIVFTKSSLSEISYKVEKMKTSIKAQEKTNESLEMKINELASLENIEKIIKKEKLSYNNNNIKNIE